MTQTCLACGEPLPVGSSRSRRYCAECARKRNLELTVKRQQQAAVARAAMAQQRTEDADRAWCRRCVYRSPHIESNLCDYLLNTGKRRGCKAGKGCERRVL